MFADAGAVLSLWAGLAQARPGLAPTAVMTALRSPDGRVLAIVHGPASWALPLLASAGGLLYLGDGARFRPARADGQPLIASSEGAAAGLDTSGWPALDFQALLGGLNGQPSLRRAARYPTALALFAPAALGSYIVQRAHARGASATLTPARWRPLGPRLTARDGLWIQLDTASDPRAVHRRHGRYRPEPDQGRPQPGASWSRSLCDLPGVVVARAVGQPLREAPLYIDVRYRVPGDERALAALANSHTPDHPADDRASPGRAAIDSARAAADVIPTGALWLLAGPDFGHGCVELLGPPVASASFLAPPDTVPMSPPATDRPLTPAAIPLALVRSPARASTAPQLADSFDAVLLDDRELSWLRRYLMTRPMTERAYVILGASEHLLFYLGADVVPFGCPLRRVGERGLYVERGFDFAPPIPAGAYTHAFGLERDQLAVFTARRALSFDARALTPAWMMWIGAAPALHPAAPDEAASADVMRALEATKARLGAEHDREAPRFFTAVDTAPAAGAPVTADERARLRDDAAADLVRGDWAAAAHKLERAGDASEAARLYERAALASVAVERAEDAAATVGDTAAAAVDDTVAPAVDDGTETR